MYQHFTVVRVVEPNSSGGTVYHLSRRKGCATVVPPANNSGQKSLRMQSQKEATARGLRMRRTISLR